MQMYLFCFGKLFEKKLIFVLFFFSSLTQQKNNNTTRIYKVGCFSKSYVIYIYIYQSNTTKEVIINVWRIMNQKSKDSGECYVN